MRKTLIADARSILLVLLLLLPLCGCDDDWTPKDTASLLSPKFTRSEVIGFVAGLGTTFAAFPDLLRMLKRRSSAGMNPTMVSIMAVFQLLWIYYGLLIASRPVVAWNTLAVLINVFTVIAFRRFRRLETGAGSRTKTERV
jgi:uncharacterized protein with PQ loop repeat